MHRREFVASTTATIAAASLAGCSGVLGGDGGGSGPERALEAYVDAVNANDPDAFEAAMYPDAPVTGRLPTASELDSISVSIAASEVTEGPEDGWAVVSAVLETTVRATDAQRTRRREVSFEVRKHEGRWKLYRELRVGSGSEGRSDAVSQRSLQHWS